MNSKEVLIKIKADLKSGQFNYNLHAIKRMNERMITSADIECLISEGLKRFKYRDDHYSWNFFGHDLDNNELTISVRYEDGTTIVTVF